MEIEKNLSYRGLSSDAANHLIANEKNNKQPKSPGKTIGQILFSNFFTLFNLLNFALAAALIAVGSYKNILFLGVVFSNTFIGTLQEVRAKRTIDKLELMSAPMIDVIRDDIIHNIPTEMLVPGDLIILHPGNQLCTDGEVIFGQGALNESLLTGESEPIEKKTGDKLLSGSFVTEGTIYAKVTNVGADSYAAKLTLSAKAIKKPHSQLMQSMRNIIRGVSVVLVPIGILLFCKQYFILHSPLQSAVTASVASMLGMIPEGLMLLTSVALAVGVIRLGKRNTLVQELYGIESLARVDTLCIDKTGTITKGTMAVKNIILLNNMDLSATEAALNGLTKALNDNNATFAALKEKYNQNSNWEALHTVPFSSARKWSGASFANHNSYIIGAAEFILNNVSQDLAQTISNYSQQGMRVLLLCHSENKINNKDLPQGLSPMALVLLSDVVREDAKPTLAFFHEQGVNIKVISGDNPLTVMSVAKEAGLSGAEKCIDATALNTPEKIREAAGEYTVFGRVTPEQKKDIIMALKEKGHTVGMMGDGVNDIPALKASDCSIAMAGGSDATKRIAQLSLLDGNFSAVPDIVLEGRRVINNITRAASLFLVKTIFSFLLSIILLIIPAQYPFAPIQMTLISSLTVGIPSFFLALEPNKSRVQGNFLINVLKNALPGALSVVILILTIFVLTGPLGITVQEQSTMATVLTGFSGLTVLFFTCRPLNYNRAMLLILMTGGFFGALFFASRLFNLVPLRLPLLLITIGLMALTPLLMTGLRKAAKKADKHFNKIKIINEAQA